MRQPETARRRFPQRTLHVVDIENLAGTPLPTLRQVSQVQGLYNARLGLSADDQVVMAASHRGLLNAALGWPHARYRVRSGPNGADLELIDVLLHEDIPARFTHVVIGSGDGRFLRAALVLTGGGVRVTVASRTGSLSHLLRQAASDVVYLDLPRPVTARLPAAASAATRAEVRLPTAA
ncbi:MAG: hypothetical protein J2P26_00655 [Nocardiopsaceae bacterium]|nr:hypothetical protein [Nocardiopsaceae bacterium]